ncbi:MAG: YfhO family protein [Balneolaceae bacterium]
MYQSSDPNSSDFFSQLPSSRQHIIALAILFVIPLILFFDTTLGGKELQRHDITQWRAGAESVIEYREEFDREPLWVSNMYMGMPAFPVSVTNATPHIDIIARFFHTIYPAFQYWVMLSGMYVLLIFMGFRPLTAVFGSLTYALTAYFPIIIGAGHTSKFFALALAPWIIAGYWRLTRTNNKLSGLLLFTVAFALEVRAGHPQITYYFMYLLGFLWISDSWKQIKAKKYKNFGVITGFLLVGGIIGVLGNAQSFLTLQEYAKYSIRGGSALAGTSGLSTGYAFAWSQGIKETLTLFVPELFGGASPNYFGPKSGTSGPHYLGALVVPFMLIGLFKVKTRTIFVFFGTGTLAIVFAWGGNFLLINQLAFDHIPLFDKFRAPETWLVITSFCYTIVAVYGLSWFFEFLSKKQKSIQKLYIPFGTTLLIFVFLFIQVKSMDYTKPGEVDNIAAQIARQNQMNPSNPQVLQQANNYVQTNLVPEREGRANSDVLRFGLFLALTAGIIWFALHGKLSIGISSLGIILLVGIDMISVGKRYIPEKVIVNANVSPTKYLETQRTELNQFIVDNISETDIYPNRVFPLLGDPFQDAVPAYFYPVIGGYTGAKLSIVADIQNNDGPLFKGNGGLNLELLGALNIKYVTYQQGLAMPGLTQVFAGRTGAVYENEKLLPKAFFVDSVVSVSSPVEAFDFINRSGVDYSNVAVVETSKMISVNPDSTSSVTFTNYTGPEMTMEISRKNSGFLVLSEVYYPAGWKATLNGEEIPIHKTNYVLRGLEIPAGTHTLTLEFRPNSYYTGVTIGWISLSLQALLALFVGFSFWRERNTISET